jgi:hypothetical protein
MLFDRLQTSIPLLALALGLAFSVQARADQQHCPPSSPGNSQVVCGNGCDPNADKARLESLAVSIKKTKAPVCLLAMVDPQDRGYSKKLAIKRALWVRDTLIEHGVLSNSIAVELRPLPPDGDKMSLRHIDVILGQ